jgi:tRNA U34 5-carboxymethylaminomethyl modifying GTPase MnmE/TrmE
MEIDVKKVMGKTPKNVFEASDKMIKAHQEIIEALHIMQSAIDYPECFEQNEKRMKQFLTKFCKDETITAG